MSNPIIQALGGAQMPPIVGQIKNIMSMMRASQNPTAMLNSLINSNPQYRQAVEYINANGGDAKAAFYKMAEEKGVDPNEVLNMLK